jgi:hypothetical protein
VFNDQKTAWLKKSVSQHLRLLKGLRDRYFSYEQTSYDNYKELLNYVTRQYKLMQEEYDVRKGRI